MEINMHPFYLFLNLLVSYSIVTISSWNATWQSILISLDLNRLWVEPFQNPVSDLQYVGVFHKYVYCTEERLLSKKRKGQRERGAVKEPEAEWPDVLSAVLLRERRRKEMEKHDGGKEAKKWREDQGAAARSTNTKWRLQQIVLININIW